MSEIEEEKNEIEIRSDIVWTFKNENVVQDNSFTETLTTTNGSYKWKLGNTHTHTKHIDLKLLVRKFNSS